MKRGKVLITIPEFGEEQNLRNQTMTIGPQGVPGPLLQLGTRQRLLRQIADISPCLDIEQRTCATSDAVASALRDIEILYTLWVPAHLNEANRLKWVQLHSTGIDNKVGNPIFDPARGIVVTNVAGAHAVAIAEYCLTTMSMLARGFLTLIGDMRTRTRNRRHSPLVQLWGQTIGIIGYGHIGREVGRLAKAHNMRILAVKRHPHQRCASGYQWKGEGDPEGAFPECFFEPHEQHSVLRECDFVVCCMPLTQETREMFSESEFSAMKRTAYFINVGRGGTVDDMALARALRDKALAGAGLDVLTTDPNPLPPDHPLWMIENVFISPHISGNRNEQYFYRTNELFCENLRRYTRNERLLNEVTRERGY